MLRCIDIPSRADGFVDGDGPLGERASVALHLTICSHCRTYVRGLRATRRLLADSFAEPAPDALVADLSRPRPDRTPDRSGAHD